MNQLSDEIIGGRHRLGLSQEELANKSGISLRTIQRIEKGQVSPHAHTLKTLSDVLGIDFSILQAERIHESVDEKYLRTLNALGFLVIVIPLIHLVIQLIYFYRMPRSSNDPPAKRMISLQFLWLLLVAITILLLNIGSHLIAGQSVVGHFPLRTTVYVCLLLVNVSLGIQSAIRLNHSKTDVLRWVPSLF